MKAEIIPLVIVNDVLETIKYLETYCKFELIRTAYQQEFAVMEYRGATLMLQSRKLYNQGRGVPIEEHRGTGIEILVRIQGVMEAYIDTVNRGGTIVAHLHGVAETPESAVHRFSITLPDRQIITFFEYVPNMKESQK